MNLDTLTLDQLRIFVAVAEYGGFAAAGRALGRSQSVISYGISNLEDNINDTLFDRTIRRQITLTPQGVVLVEEAKRVLAQAELFASRAKNIQEGQEQEITLVVDMMFPMKGLVDLCTRCKTTHKDVTLRVFTEAMGGVSERVAQETNAIGVQGPDGLSREMAMTPLSSIELVSVVARDHDLAQIDGPITTPVIHEHTQIVLLDGATNTTKQHPSVLAPPSKQWHTADLHTKKELILAGLGWGNLPRHMIREAITDGTLKIIEPQAWMYVQWTLPLYAIVPKTTHVGPVTAWILAQLTQLCMLHLEDDATPTP